jgi:hypothetical protein
MERWEDVEAFAIAEAERDLQAGEAMSQPLLTAWSGRDLQFLAVMRGFAKGAYHQPLTELLTLAGRLDADRVSFAITGRAWSMDDPIPPVTEDGDLRQRVLVVELADAAGGRPRHRSVIVPFADPEPGRPIAWGERQELPASEGWISHALRRAVTPEARRSLRCSDRRIAREALRCDRLGHVLGFSDEVVDRMQRGLRATARSR